MRSDMGKLITERERSGGHYSRAGRDRDTVRWSGHDADYDDQPRLGKIAPGSRHSYYAKQFSDVLGPLYGYLRKQVGRPWDKIYSELCRHLDKRKLTHAHVFTHVFQLVGVHVRCCTDGIYREKDSVRSRLTDQGVYEEYGYAPELYVHPRTGLLRKNKLESKAQRKLRLEREKTYDQLRFADGREWRKIDGIWYDYRLVPVDLSELRTMHGLTWNGTNQPFRELRRQLNKKELRLVRQTLGKREKA